MNERARSSGGPAAARPSPAGAGASERARPLDLRFARVEVLSGDGPPPDSDGCGARDDGAGRHASGAHVYSSALWLIIAICCLAVAVISLLPRRLLRRPIRGAALLLAGTRERAGPTVRLRSAGARLASRAKASASTIASAAFCPVPQKK